MEERGREDALVSAASTLLHREGIMGFYSYEVPTARGSRAPSLQGLRGQQGRQETREACF